MKSIFTFFILYNVVVAKPYNEDDCSMESIQWYTQKKFGKLTDLIDYFTNPTDDKLTCMLACYVREHAHEQMGKTLYEATTEYINIAYTTGFKTNKFTRKDVESKVSNCKAQEQDNCAFFKCVDYYHTPVSDILLHDPQLRFWIEVAKHYYAVQTNATMNAIMNQ